MNTTFTIKGDHKEAAVIEELFDGMVNANISANSVRVTVIVHNEQAELASEILKDAGFI